MAHLHKIPLTLTTVAPKYNSTDKTFENSYRFQFKVHESITANALMTYTGENADKPLYLDGTTVKVVLGKEFMAGYGLHAPCARDLPEHVRASRGTFFPPHTLCKCSAHAENKQFEKAKRAAKAANDGAYKRRKGEKIAKSAAGSSNLFK